MMKVDSRMGGLLGFTVNFRLFFVCLVLFLGFVGGASAATLDVPGTYSTIQTAINAANIGDTINVSAGTYTENVDVTKPVNLVGAGGGVTIVQTASSSDHVFYVTADSVNVSGFTLTDATNYPYAGIYLDGADYAGISNNTVTNNYFGIYLYIGYSPHSSNSTISNNIASNNVIGIFLDSPDNNTISNNAASNNTAGIYLAFSSSNTITNNNANSNTWNGIYLAYSGRNTITNNTANSNGNAGIYLEYFSSKNTIYNNYFNNTNNTGFVGTTNDWNTTKQAGTNIIGGPYLGGNYWANPSGTGFSETCTDVDSDGICDSGYTLASGNVDYLPFISTSTPPTTSTTATTTTTSTSSTTTTTITTTTTTTTIPSSGGPTQIGSCTTISSPGEYILISDLSSSDTCITIESSDVVFDGQDYTINGTDTSYTYGVYVYNSTAITNVTVKNVVITYWGYGIYYRNAANGSIENNNASNNYYGISLSRYSNRNTLTNNNASNNEWGISLSSSSNNNLSGNTMSTNTYNFYVDGSSIFDFVHTIDATNTVDGKPVYYLIGVSDLVIDSSSSTGYVGVVNGVNVTIKDLTLTRNGQGVLFANTSNSSVLNVNASNNGVGIRFSSSSSNTITNNNASNNGNGIILYNSSSNAITNNNASNNYNGIWLFSSSRNAITRNTANSNRWDGIYLHDYSNNNTIIDNTANSNNHDGITLYDYSNYNTIIDNTANSNGAGIVLWPSSRNTLTNNTANSNNYNGIYLSDFSSNNILTDNNASNNGNGISLTWYSYKNTLTNNTANSNTWNGIYLSSSTSSNTLKNNTASNNNYGIYLRSSSDYNTLTNNTANSNTYYGIYLNSSSSNTLTNNTANSNYRDGIYLDSSSYNTIYNNTANSNHGWSGIHIFSSSSNTLTGNNANSNNLDGIYFQYSSSNTLTDNTALNNDYGIYLFYSGNNTLTGNNALNNSRGIYLDSSSSNTLTNNTASNNNAGISLGSSSNYNILSGNTASSNVNGILLDSSSNNTLSGNTASNNGDGISLTGYISYYSYSSNYNTLSGSTIFNTTNAGIRIESSSDSNNVTDNNITRYCTGVAVSNSSFNDILNNTIQNSSTCSEGRGVDIDGGGGSNNTISGNTIRRNGYGVYLFNEDWTVIKGNFIFNNTWGAYLTNSFDNTIYNNFFNNTNNTYDDSANSWNTTKTSGTNIIGGPYLGGNHYSDYNGNDADGDGFGDINYSISSGANVDYLPLVDSYSPTITINSPQNTTYNTHNIVFDITTSEAIDANAGVLVYTIDVNAGLLYVPLIDDTPTRWYNDTVSLPSDGRYNATFQVTDLAGNPNSSTVWFSIDTTTPPTTTTSTTTSSTTSSTTTTTTSSTTTTTIGGGNGGGGGGGGGGAATSFEVWIRDVLAGQTFELDINDEDVPYINGLSLTAKQAIYSSKLSITDYDKKPWYGMEEPDANVFRYFKVSYDKKNDVQNASFDFRVNRSWLEDSNISQYAVKMYRYTTGWDELGTEFIKEDDEWVYLRAGTPGFSYFSIGGETGSGYKPLEEEEVSPIPIEEEPGTVEPPEVETPTPASPVETSEPDQGPEKAPKEGKGGICGPTVVVLISMLVLLFTRGMREMKR